MVTAETAVGRLAARLGEIVGEMHVAEPTAEYLGDETETRGARGRADLVVKPGTAKMSWIRRTC